MKSDSLNRMIPAKLKAKVIRSVGSTNEDEFYKTVTQFVKFGLVGVSNTLISWICYYVFLWIDEKLYIVGSIVASIVSIANAFFWNDKYVFKGNKNDFLSKLKRLGKTYVSYGSTSLLGLLLLYIEVQFFGLNKAWAPPLNLVLTIPLNFFINKFWTFKDKENKK